ncbi:MAG: sigma-70 family RNA polymerase sigma factor [Gelidibacter sp.]|nr:sigma-70 family RNA polymerase sigma factor [Gelidibacter sp.]
MQKAELNLTSTAYNSQLIEGLKCNDEQSLQSLYQSNYAKVEALILKNNGTRDHAKDIYQEAFIVVWKNVKDKKFIPQNETALHGYLYTISKNKWMDYLRSKHYKKTVVTSKLNHFELSDVDHEKKDDDIIKENRLEGIMAAFKTMGSPCKELLTTFYFEKKSLRDIADELQIEENTARNKKYRCMEKLRELVLASKS